MFPTKLNFALYFWLIALVVLPGTTEPQLAAHPRSSKKEVRTATELRLLDSGWWPTKGIAARKDYVGTAVCAHCHADIVNTQKNTQMEHALTMASAAAFPEVSNGPLSFVAGSYHYSLSSTSSGAQYSVVHDAQTLSVPVDWIFGNGGFGRTYVYQQHGNFYESRVSYYRSGKLLDFTTGNPRSQPDQIENALGRRMLPTEAAFCFGCHATAATTGDHFDEKQLIPGVTCEACHGPGAEHATQMNLGNLQSRSRIMNPAKLGAVDSVDFCGACHRTSVDVALSGVTGIYTLRFPAYRLQRSRCWGTGDARITCTSCHNPHEPLLRNAEAYDKNCLSCHLNGSASPTSHAELNSSVRLAKTKSTIGKACPVAQKSCATCHMPKYTIPEMHTSFTDHRIAIPSKDKSFVE